MSTFVKSCCLSSFVSCVLVGCGGSDAGSVISSVVVSGEQQIVDSATAEKGYPEWVLPSAHGLCPTWCDFHQVLSAWDERGQVAGLESIADTGLEAHRVCQ